jgi:hypothetical protein
MPGIAMERLQAHRNVELFLGTCDIDATVPESRR